MDSGFSQSDGSVIYDAIALVGSRGNRIATTS